MSVTNVYHKTRDRIYKMNFSASGETTWSFTAESDGEIYAVESNNVASYTINGGSVSLPFSLTSGNSYAVAVTKTNAEQVADITFRSRRVIEKITSQNVPDFGAFDGRYLYVLNDENTLFKYDSDLLNLSNYEGSGVWTQNPLVAQINLPIPSNYTIKWDHINFDDGDIIVWGRNLDASPSGARVCRVKPDDSVYDYYENNLNEITVAPFSLNYNERTYIQAIGNNYIDGHYALAQRATAGDISGQKVEKNDLSLTNTSSPRISGSNAFQRIFFDPYTKRFLGDGDFSVEEDRFFNFMCFNTSRREGAILRSTGYRYKSLTNNPGFIQVYDDTGSQVANLSSGSPYYGAVTAVHFSVDQIKNRIMGFPVNFGSVGRFFCHNLDEGLYRYFDMDINDAEVDMSGFSYPCCSHYSENHYAISGQGWNNNDNSSTKKRVYVFKPDDIEYTNPYIGYIEIVSGNLLRIETNQYIS